MSSDIPGFYYDAVQRRYYRISPQFSNTIPSARVISDRARQEQLTSRQLELINSPSKTYHQRRQNEKKRLVTSRLSLLRQREYGQKSIRNLARLHRSEYAFILPLEFFHHRIRSNFITTLATTSLLDNAPSFSIQDPSESALNYEMTITPSGQCIQLVNYKLYLNLLKHPTYSYQLQANPVDGYRSSYFNDLPSSLMSTTLLNDENHAIIRFLQFSPTLSAGFLKMLSNNPSAPDYYYQENCQTIQLSSSLVNHSSPLMIKCSGPCCYSRTRDRFAFNINNYLYIYDLPTFQSICSARVPIRRVTLTDMKFSHENSNIIYTTNGQQFQQWDLRQSHRLSSIRMPILCSTIKCLETKFNCVLTSSFDERINLLDLRLPTKPLLTYDIPPSASPSNPHFSFAIDADSEHFVAACSQHHIAYIWDLNTGRLLNRLRCPIPERFVHTSAKCSIASVDRIPVLGVYHPEYCRVTGMIDRSAL